MRKPKVRLVEDQNGYLVTNPSTSPENSFKFDGKQIGISMASTMDMSLIRESFSILLQAAKILGIRNPFSERVEKARERKYVAEGAVEAELYTLTSKCIDIQ